MQDVPQHIAIIMDGNGRWAKKRNLPRAMGHRSGVKVVDDITEVCSNLGVKALTLYAFSTENWKRVTEEVSALMGLLEKNLREKLVLLQDNNIKFRAIGRLDKFSDSLKEAIVNMVAETENNTGMTLTLALNYGGRQEILDAAIALHNEILSSRIDLDSISEKDFEDCLYTKGLPDLDLVIRTSGEMRLSNFLLWQAAYAEFYVTDTLWPDFDRTELEKAIEVYNKRNRRFGE